MNIGSTGVTCAAQYLRMSTDAQDLSPEFQKQALAAYAGSNGVEIVATYFDAGRSGLTLHKRPAMRKLLKDVTAPDRPFSVILVYDVSRWGRFQDPDASAYHEYHCRLNGVDVRYVQEPFSSTDTPMGSVLKNLKRAMAAEYSRELMVKTRSGQKAALDAGFHMGHLPCLGIRRLACSKDGVSERPLGPYEHKSARTEHVKWVRGPEGEIAAVRRIFELYTETDISIRDLAAAANAEGLRSAGGKAFTPWMLYSLLESETVVGNFVWGRADHTLQRKRAEGEENFRRIKGVFEPIVSHETWHAAKAKRAKRTGTILSKEELLAYLRTAFDADPDFNAAKLRQLGGPCRSSYVKHFGSFANAVAELGQSVPRLGHSHHANRARTTSLGRFYRSAAEATLERAGLSCWCKHETHLLFIVNGLIRIRVQVVRCGLRNTFHPWTLTKIRHNVKFDYVLLVRINADESVFDSILASGADYYDFPCSFGDDFLGPNWTRYSSESELASVVHAIGLTS